MSFQRNTSSNKIVPNSDSVMIALGSKRRTWGKNVRVATSRRGTNSSVKPPSAATSKPQSNARLASVRSRQRASQRPNGSRHRHSSNSVRKGNKPRNNGAIHTRCQPTTSINPSSNTAAATNQRPALRRRGPIASNSTANAATLCANTPSGGTTKPPPDCASEMPYKRNPCGRSSLGY